MIDTNVVLVISGILALLLIGLILVNGRDSIPSTTYITANTTRGTTHSPTSLLGASSGNAKILPPCVTVKSSNISGLDFFEFNPRNDKIGNKIKGEISVMGNSAVLITNNTGKSIQKITLGIETDNTPNNDIWIYPLRRHTKPLALTPGIINSYYCNLEPGQSLILDVSHVDRHTKTTITINSIQVAGNF
jgi:hypothetical protein